MSGPERVAAEITSGLQRREFAVGQRLVEVDLTVKLGVSRSTIREALKILASNGVVEIVPFRGAVIRGLTLEDARNLLAVLEALTGLAARLAAGKIDVGRNRSAFKSAAAPLIQPRPPGELERILDERARFYQTIFDIADNPELNRAMPTWRAHLFRSQFYAFLTKHDLRAMVSEYRQISEAILDGNASRAERATRRHLINSGERSFPHLG
ncbi:GntR family transcriptional regulator [Caballeronia sp. 15715]|uniref:GntR family transcriptional regulator n=1 Tax=Caballeronia sp. 15715 TaxID=3391030 RepID=UPI0039E42A7D